MACVVKWAPPYSIESELVISKKQLTRTATNCKLHTCEDVQFG
jgi:hypothetical protein